LQDTLSRLHGLDFYNRFINAAVRWLNPKRVRVYTVALPFVAVAVSLVAALSDRSAKLFYQGDFILYYTAGKFFLSNRLSEIYDFSSQETFQAATLQTTSPQITPFNHPPFTAPVYALFALYSYEFGLVLWLLAGLFALALAWHLLRKELSPVAVLSTTDLTLLSFCFFPTIVWFLANQNSTFSFLIYAVFYIQLRKGREMIAGAVLGCLIYKPQLALAPVFLLLLKSRWRALIGWFLVSLAVIAAGFLLSPETMLQYLSIAPELAQLPFTTGYPTAKMHNFYGFSVLLFADLLPRALVELLAVLLMLAALVMVTLWWRTIPWEPATRLWDLTVASTFALGLLISPHLMYYDLILLLLPFAIVWACYPKQIHDRPLDGGPILVWTALAYISGFLSTYVALGMLKLTEVIGLPRIALQLTVLSIVGWAIVVSNRARDKRHLAVEAVRRSP
jgi:hypothetical protein